MSHQNGLYLFQFAPDEGHILLRFASDRQEGVKSSNRQARPPRRLAAPRFTLSGARTAEDESGLRVLETPVNLIQQRRYLLDLVDYDEFVMVGDNILA